MLRYDLALLKVRLVRGLDCFFQVALLCRIRVVASFGMSRYHRFGIWAFWKLMAVQFTLGDFSPFSNVFNSRDEAKSASVFVERTSMDVDEFWSIYVAACLHYHTPPARLICGLECRFLVVRGRGPL